MIKNGVSKNIGLNDPKNKSNSIKNIAVKKELIKNYSFKNKKSKKSSTFKEKNFNFFNFNSETTTAFYNSNSKLNKNFSKTRINENEQKRKSLLYDSIKKIEFQENKAKKNLIIKKTLNNNNNNQLMSLLFKNKNDSENNYINTNPSNSNSNKEYSNKNNKNNKNSNTEMKNKIFINKKFMEKSCPKLNMNSNNIKCIPEIINKDFNEIIEENYDNINNYNENKKKINIINSIRGKNNLMQILSPKNAKTKSQTSNLNNNKNNNKGFELRKIKTINNNKNNDNAKKDFTVNNVLEKRRPRRFESEIESKLIDSTNLFPTSKNKSSYINYEQKKLFNYSGINFIQNNNNNNNRNVNKNVNSAKYNNNFIQKSNRDSKSVTVNKNNFKNHLNKINKIVNINEPYLTNLFKMFDDFEQSRKNSITKKNNIDTKKKYSKNTKEKKKENEIDDNKIMENISQNTLTMYTIYLLNKNYKNYENKKIGIKKIQIFDCNNEEISIICYNTNADFDNGKLFNLIMTKDNYIYNKNNVSDEVSLITKINKNIHINFYLNKVKSNLVKYIKIFNYNNIEEKIYPVKDIELFKGNIKLFKGILTTDITEIQISNNKNNTNKQERNFSSSKSRTQKNINSNKNKKGSGLSDKFHTARNNMLFNYIQNENCNSLEKVNVNNKENANKNKIINSINSNINRNTINIHINNNGDSISNIEVLNNFKNMPNSNNGKQKLFNENNKFYYYSLGIPNSNSDKNINDNLGSKEIEEEMNNILKTSINTKSNMTLDKVQYNKDYTSTDFNNIEENYSNEEISFNNANTNISTNTNININVNLNSKNNNYIEFNRIKLVLISNYGHKKYVGLTGIEFYNLRGEQIHIETAQTIGALPKDLHTLYDDDNEERIFENVFNGFNNTNEKDYMWVTKLKKNEPKTFMELCFKDKLKISKIKIYNYNEKNNLGICAKHIQIFLDDHYYDTIFLNQGTGEVAFDYILSDKNKLNDDEDDNKPLDFGQDIIFPLKKLNLEENNKIKPEIKYASFLYEQNYETPFMPCGSCIKFQFVNNFYKGQSKSNYSNLKYDDIGLDSIEIYNEKNFNITDRKYNKYKLISNCEIIKENKNKIILNGAQNDENCDNCLFYLYEEEVKISYIKFYPLTKNLLPMLNSVDEVKILCDNKIIFEGNLYNEQPTIVLFTCDMKITKNINEKFLTKKYIRQCVEERKDDYISLILN